MRGPADEPATLLGCCKSAAPVTKRGPLVINNRDLDAVDNDGVHGTFTGFGGGVIVPGFATEGETSGGGFFGIAMSGFLCVGGVRPARAVQPRLKSAAGDADWTALVRADPDGRHVALADTPPHRGA